ncbi:MAG: hypothetical protein PHO14_06260 [Kiritimatiellae bacterium]|jgi:hypothetical protein|nr:hypothetical protein [Kiritimatiellia bacterium]MDD4341821.1 hypothetical protein [Kiritimatiellia bacterium]MDY0149283.1 hypothetical protein [Kiritimatiellia bacterium]
MASVNEWIVRDYLETLGFLVRQPRKYQVVARSKGPHEEVDLLAVNPQVKPTTPFPEEMLWGARELAQVHGLITTVRGWHSEKFTAAMLASSPDVYRFAEPDSVRSAAAELGVGNPAKVLCMADLPADADQRKDALEFLRSRGIDGVILFRPMLLELAERIDVKKTYEKSDLLQIMRILKNYGLLRSGQMDLFRQTRRRRPSAPKPERTDEDPLPDGADGPSESES